MKTNIGKRHVVILNSKLRYVAMTPRMIQKEVKNGSEKFYATLYGKKREIELNHYKITGAAFACVIDSAIRADEISEQKEKDLRKELRKLQKSWVSAQQKNNRIQAQAIESRIRIVSAMIHNLVSTIKIKPIEKTIQSTWVGVSQYFAD